MNLSMNATAVPAGRAGWQVAAPIDVAGSGVGPAHGPLAVLHPQLRPATILPVRDLWSGGRLGTVAVPS
jgi:hypothetical protein